MGRYDVERALRASSLKPLARLVAWALLSRADTDTAAVPPKFSPSLSALAADTGLGRSSVAYYLNVLESGGWVTRRRDLERARTEKTPTRYQLHVPASPAGGLVREMDQSQTRTSPAHGPELVREMDSASPGAGHNKTTSIPKQDQIHVRDDVASVCEHLADAIEANGSKRPKVTKRWHDAARLMIDRDGRTPEQITRCVDWCQKDEFWRSNILSMPKLRDRYDQLRLQASRPAANSRRKDGIDWDDQLARARAADAARGEMK